VFVVMLVLDQQELLPRVLDAWQEAGVRGATVLESTGMHRIRQCRLRLHARFDLAHIADECMESHYTLFAVVEDMALVEACLAATEGVTGDLSQPNTGVFVAWPVAFAKGVSTGLVDGRES
jgi:nitrogen regulatory protein P-II 1